MKRFVSRAIPNYNVLLEEKQALFPPRLVLAGQDYAKVGFRTLILWVAVLFVCRGNGGWMGLVVRAFIIRS